MLTCYIRSPFVSLPSVDECDRILTQQRRYTAQDIDVCARLRRSLDEAGENGLDEQDLHVAHLRLLEPQSGRTRTLQQYLKVNGCSAVGEGFIYVSLFLSFLGYVCRFTEPPSSLYYLLKNENWRKCIAWRSRELPT